MRRTQQRKEEMYVAIELWQESGLSQRAFCEKEQISYHVFGYWLKKFRKEKASEAATANGFVGLNVEAPPAVDRISIRYPNGVLVSCSEQLALQKLKTLIWL